MSKMSTSPQPAVTLSTRFSAAASDESIAKAKAALEINGFVVKVVDDLDQAKSAVNKIIPEKSEVFTATSKTLEKSGLDIELNDSGRFVSVRNMFMPLYGQPDKALEMKRIGAASDYAVGSVHALTQDGQAVIASASGSQLPNYAYGASNVIWVVGSQKIVKDLAEGLERIENYAYHLEDERALAAYGTHSSINKLLIYRKEPSKRVSIIIVKEPVGF